MKFTKWTARDLRGDEIEYIKKELGVSVLCAKTLVSRGITKAHEFLSGDISRLHDPFLMPDMEKAVRRIKKAISQNEKITVYGDYDVDGITATYILSDYLKTCGAQVDYYIPNRIEEGYGINSDALNKIIDSGTSLIITVDTGITAHEEVLQATTRNCDVVITDHHECRETLPEAVAVVNPHRIDSKYPFPSIAGVCVAFKLICALEGTVCDKYFQFVCIGTIADIMPVIDENRAIVKKGLEDINSAPTPAISALIEKADLSGKRITSESIGYGIAPRINAAGRMDSAIRVVELFNEDSIESAMQRAQVLCDLNRARQDEERRIYEQVLELLPTVFDEKKDGAIVLAGDDWHHGVIGIVASRLNNKYDLPVILLTKEGEIAKGSGRGVAGINLYEMLCNAKDLLLQYGGHEMAVGLTIEIKNIEALREYINSAVKQAHSGAVSELEADFEVKAGELTVSEIEGLTYLEPYGEGNEQPLLLMRNAYVEKITPIGNGRHLKFKISQNGRSVDGVYFGKTVKDISFTEGEIVDVMFQPAINDFRGKTVQMLISDIRLSEAELERVCKAKKLYDKIKNSAASREEYILCNPNYDELGAAWKAIKKLSGSERFSLAKISNTTGLSCEKILVATDVFEELGLLKYEINMFCFAAELTAISGKVDLNNSKILRDIAQKIVG